MRISHGRVRLQVAYCLPARISKNFAHDARSFIGGRRSNNLLPALSIGAIAVGEGLRFAA
jgi:hypothetical protein